MPQRPDPKTLHQLMEGFIASIEDKLMVETSHQDAAPYFSKVRQLPESYVVKGAPESISLLAATLRRFNIRYVSDNCLISGKGILIPYGEDDLAKKIDAARAHVTHELSWFEQVLGMPLNSEEVPWV